MRFLILVLIATSSFAAEVVKKPAKVPPTPAATAVPMAAVTDLAKADTAFLAVMKPWIESLKAIENPTSSKLIERYNSARSTLQRIIGADSGMNENTMAHAIANLLDDETVMVINQVVSTAKSPAPSR